MGIRPPCCDKLSVKKGLWTAEEDAKLLAYVSTHGTGNWTTVPKKAGLKRCGKSCRLRWTNYLRPNLKHEGFSPQEEELIVTLHATIGSRWSIIANQLPGRTDNDVKNYWNTKLSKKLAQRGIDPVTHRPISEVKQSITSLHISGAGSVPAGKLRPFHVGSVNRDLKNILFPKPIPSPQTASSSTSSLLPPQPPPQDLDWIDQLLAEEAFSCIDETESHAKEASVVCTGVKDAAALPYVSWEQCFGKAEEEVVGGGMVAGGSSSFIDGILDRDREIVAEFASLLGDNYLFN
ncbi:hypothetical protein HPP92_024844 [Vanilla planifolia]|uniref:Uncharacterized protein n=1 Tax=Vanilla planifolia TaxID=51239 RepID=A0A835PJH0_VANPL|nr:hypothetical protein HPP92_025109 [Vanilla planifolia]KAG0453540.1 hypothetical protein HPP92_024844 [Vanilla planifolia]